MVSRRLTEDQRDCLQECCNLAMGRAGDVAARQLDCFVTLSIPLVAETDAAGLAGRLAGRGELCGVIMDFACDGGSARAALVVSRAELAHLTELPAAAGQAGAEVMKLLGEGMLQVCLEELAQQWQQPLTLSPARWTEAAQVLEFAEHLLPAAGTCLALGMSYQLEATETALELLLWLDERAAASVSRDVERLLRE